MSINTIEQSSRFYFDDIHIVIICAKKKAPDYRSNPELTISEK